MNKIATRNRGAFDQTAEIYDVDMGRNAPLGDIEFYIAHARRAGGPVLELGCGTGRITIPLVKAGFEVEGVDASLPMLKVLESKAAYSLTSAERARLQYREADMCDFDSGRCFSQVICPFSTFNYLLEESEQAAVLERVRACLKPGGRFIFDVFVPHYDILLLPDEYVFRDYRRILPDGSVLTREKNICRDLTHQINAISRTYRLYNTRGEEIRCVVTRERIRYFFFSELKLLLRGFGFHVEEGLGDFQGHPYSYDVQSMVFICAPAIRT